ncbi:unnamed protein product [Chrysodeixis includens]|uniref:FLYWCH-type domain-containing protein n=1 Tax=Chrysodeixis includens TaxID=689277 RepID=A0A9N8Q020_CHRIL|nr:unnamed protein product [Chrysodeixis includens]
MGAEHGWEGGGLDQRLYILPPRYVEEHRELAMHVWQQVQGAHYSGHPQQGYREAQLGAQPRLRKLYVTGFRYYRKSSGREVAMVNGYTFFCDGRSKVSEVWICTKGKNCRARFRMSKDRTVMRRVGLVGGHTFYCDKGKRTTTAVWRCTRGSLCKARFKVGKEDQFIISAFLEHSHPASDYVVRNVPVFSTTKAGNPVIVIGRYRYNKCMKWMMKKNGKELAMVNGYTFYCHKNNAKTKIWTCTSGWLCKARLITCSARSPEARTVISAKLQHIHPPPTYIISNGFYVRI